MDLVIVKSFGCWTYHLFSLFLLLCPKKFSIGTIFQLCAHPRGGPLIVQAGSITLKHQQQSSRVDSILIDSAQAAVDPKPLKNTRDLSVFTKKKKNVKLTNEMVFIDHNYHRPYLFYFICVFLCLFFNGWTCAFIFWGLFQVRYQSRKMLAEQRPRIKGQFVRQNVSEHTSQNAD